MPSNLPIPLPLSPIDLPSDSTSSSTKPKCKIFTAADLDPWFLSRAYADLESYTLELCHSVEGKRVEEDCFESEATRRIIAFLKEMETLIEEIPLQTTPQRFGNKAFRDWLEKVTERNDDFQNSLFPTEPDPTLVPELSFNLLHSFGSGPRLDYGTGHELSFLLWLLCLRHLEIISPQDNRAVVLRIFSAYLDLVRKLQKVFKLEPAGSKGVWGLDDHQHLSYLFGASQLIDHSTLRPSHILQPRILAPLASSYLLPASILHIHALKSGPFAEHSPLLHQIASTVPNWTKVQSGLWKMYREEVLAKVPIVQHLRFGRLIRWADKETGSELPSTGDTREEEEENEDAEQESSGAKSGMLRAPWLEGSGSSTSSPTSTHQTTLSQASARRIPYTVSSAASSSKPTNFAPPTLFPPRISSTTQATAFPGPNRRTVAEEGGPAAQSSPFGTLKSATIGMHEGKGNARGSRLEPVGTKAPWAS